jgi:hypothetical protein
MPRHITAGHAAVIAHMVEVCQAVLQLITLDAPPSSDRLIRTAQLIGRASEAVQELPAAEWQLMLDDITTTEKRNITGTLQLCELVLQKLADGGLSAPAEMADFLGRMIEDLRCTRATGYPVAVVNNPKLGFTTVWPSS